MVTDDLEAARKNRERIEAFRRKEQEGRKPVTTNRISTPRNPTESSEAPKEMENHATPKPATRGVYKKGKYLDEHRDEILADRLALGLRSTLKKWTIGSSTWRYTEKRWVEEGYTIANIKGSEEHRGGIHEHKEKEIKIEGVEQVSPLAETPIVTEEPKQSKIRTTFRWLISEDIEPSYEMSDELLVKYLKEEPDETMKELQEFIEGEEFSVDKLHRAMFSVYIKELLESMPDFKKTRSGEYQYEGK